ncbi:MAG TPA: hypothetical protein VGH13_11550 [Xanthobacteraceae bacterium]
MTTKSPAEQIDVRLLPCPFCGSAPDTLLRGHYFAHDVEQKKSAKKGAILCPTCQTRSPEASWNTRQPAVSAGEPVEAEYVKKVCKGLRRGQALGNEAAANLIEALYLKSLAALPPSNPPGAEPFTAADAWHDLIEKDDRTSPEEYPDHALITADELADYIQRALAPNPPGDVREKVIEALTLCEDVLSRAPFSTEILPNGMHPQLLITKVRDALELASPKDAEASPDVSAHERESPSTGEPK